ncbi:MAG TPA: transcriptional regulator [Candidatus Sulfotelmatobacter sp.]|jgi:DNA-binding MarR family transcriptional regulator|nr:transcriptional regulator [Candidatus Sulfotelmatobacter sp.]
MNDDRDMMPSPNRLVHEPARLAILTVLSSCASADFVFLQNATGLSKGNLSVQLTNLEQAGLVIITKEIIDKKMRTTVSLSKRGASEIDEYWKTMDAIRARMASAEEHRRPRRGPALPLPARFSPVSNT